MKQKKIDIEYQARRHLAVQLLQWPRLDPAATLARIRDRLMRGDAWLWPEPIQLQLFEDDAKT